MHFSTIIATALVGASTMAFPAYKRAVLCPGLESTPQCCAVDALGVADVNCAPRTLCSALLISVSLFLFFRLSNNMNIFTASPQP